MPNDRQNLRSLLTEVYSALEYMDDIGLSGLIPKLPPKKYLQLTSERPAGPSLAQKYANPSQASQSPPRPSPYAPPQELSATPSGRAQEPKSRPYPPAAPRPSARRLSPSEILAQAGYARGQEVSPGPYQNYPGPTDYGPDYQGGHQGPLSLPGQPVGNQRQPESAITRACKEPERLTSIDTSWIEGAQTIEGLNESLASCLNCRLNQPGNRPVPGRGLEGAKIMFIFDIPGPEAIQSLAIPNGPEADLFDNIVDKGLKMTADQVYVTAISKCPVPDPANYPETFPLKACAHFLFREIELVGPKVIVALGDKPALRLSGLERTSFQFLRGQRLIIGRAKKIPLKVTYDLPTIMECVDIKREFWNDLKGAMKFLT